MSTSADAEPVFSEELPVLIIGAGTGGLALAHGLRASGVPVRVFERDRHRMDGLQGFRVGISPNGVRALRAVLPGELFATFVATTATDYRYYSMCTERLRPLLSLDSRELGPDVDHEEVVRDYSVSRMTMRQVLLTGLTDVVEFGRKFAGFTDHGDRVTARFEDGSSATGRLLVGADGANSRVRRQFLPHAGQTETGLVALGGKQAITPANDTLLTGRTRQGMSLVFDRRGAMGIVHVMEFPWQLGRENGAGIGGTDPELVARWPGLRFDNTTDYFSWGLSVSKDVLPDDVFSLDGAALQELALREVIHDWHPNLRALVRDSEPGSTMALSVRTSDPLPEWQPGRVTVLGDAAHTMTPGRGAGANTALRDAQLLGDRLAAAHAGTTSLRDAVGSYEARMRVYSALAVRDSLQGMHDNGLAAKPVRRWLASTGMRTGLRVVDRVPALRSRFANSMQRSRDSERADS